MLSALVVDHDRADALPTGTALAPAGFLIPLAADGTQAIAAQVATHLDLVICDLSVAGKDGQTLVQTLRARDASAICIATTPDPCPNAHQRRPEAGAALCLSKPVNPAVLVAIARQLVTRGPLRDPREDPFDTELTDQIRPQYLDLLPTRAATLRDLPELTDLARACRELVGASAQFGYPGLAELCRILEQEARFGRHDTELVEVVQAVAGHIQRTSR